MMKKLLIGLLIGLTIGYAASASAAVGDTVSAVFASFNYVVNGTDKAVSSPVLVYEGTSYVRTTDIGNMLGFDVTYRSDSRTISFSGGPTPNPTLAPSPTPTTVTGGTYGPTPSVTPISTGAPDPNATPAPSTAPTTSPDPNATPVPTVVPTPTVTPTPTPAPSNTAQCEAIRHDYAYQIAMVEYTPGNQGQHMQAVLVLEYQRNQALSAAGCN